MSSSPVRTAHAPESVNDEDAEDRRDDRCSGEQGGLLKERAHARSEGSGCAPEYAEADEYSVTECHPLKQQPVQPDAEVHGCCW